jgi:hypothetical protein
MNTATDAHAKIIPVGIQLSAGRFDGSAECREPFIHFCHLQIPRHP